MQRFDSALRLNVHLHVLWLDGVYSREPGRSGVEWCEHAQITDADVAQIVRRVRDRVLRKLRQMGKWSDADDAADADGAPDASDGEQLLLALESAAVQGVAAIGERAGRRDQRIRTGTRGEPFVKGPLCADFDGFSLHAHVRVAAGNRRQLEHLCRYAGRPAVAESRLSLLPDGRVAYALKKTWKDGTTSVVFEPGVLIERLLALVPRPRRHLVTYHGVLAPAASLRSQIVPRANVEEDEEAVGDDGQQGDELLLVDAGMQDSSEPGVHRPRVPHLPGKLRRGGRRYYRWAELLWRVYGVAVFTCPRCGGARRLLAAILDPVSIERVLRAMGLPCEVPELAPARAPPGSEQGWFGA